MHLRADGSVQMQLNCNRAQGTWSVTPAADGASGRFQFGPLAATRALCPPPSMDEMIVAQAGFVRGYLLKDGNLYLSLMADAGIFAWAPEPGGTAAVPAAPADGGPRGYLPADMLAPATAPDGAVPTGEVAAADCDQRMTSTRARCPGIEPNAVSQVTSVAPRASARTR
jgi:hypothetical protein